MDVLVMLEESPDPSPVLARVDSFPAALVRERQGRDVVTLYGTPNSEALALALAAVVEIHRETGNGNGSGAFQHLGVWPERGAVGDTAWRDRVTGELMTRDLDIPIEVLARTAHQLTDACGTLLRRLVAGLAMPDWPEGTWRAISFTLDPQFDAVPAAASRYESILDALREADGLTYEYEGD